MTIRQFVFFALGIAANTATISASPLPTTTEPPITIVSTSPAWSNEAIITFVGVMIAIIGILVTLALSSSTSRRWLLWPLQYCISSKHQRALQRDVEDWLEFKEWKKLSNGLNTS
ncbi:hypothetical protein HBH50_134630 [Parastagonospora nodorum]|nr:hypothetical protein HBH50_134630 [Parastagonospora nodorum]KAH4085316.1 hypothetical protein HBH48_159340 [Parastagonospora nodorum]